VAVTTAVGAVEEIGPVTSDGVVRLGQALAAAGQQPRGPLIGLFPLDLADRLSPTTHAPLAWIGERGHAVGGGQREVYLSDPRRTTPEQLVTQLMIKIEEERA
jgi:hypothetical protein